MEIPVERRIGLSERAVDDEHRAAGRRRVGAEDALYGLGAGRQTGAGGSAEIEDLDTGIADNDGQALLGQTVGRVRIVHNVRRGIVHLDGGAAGEPERAQVGRERCAADQSARLSVLGVTHTDIDVDDAVTAADVDDEGPQRRGGGLQSLSASFGQLFHESLAQPLVVEIVPRGAVAGQETLDHGQRVLEAPQRPVELPQVFGGRDQRVERTAVADR
ncbi:MAG: hypothetical protein MOGMAGMI_02051 [Candidatus Omnitrophica bacterium]|nr:hypothetical protein [Candidatus Omnitrophota bacterium]